MCPDQDLNRQPYGLRDDAQPTEPHWQEPPFTFLKNCVVFTQLYNKYDSFYVLQFISLILQSF